MMNEYSLSLKTGDMILELTDVPVLVLYDITSLVKIKKGHHVWACLVSDEIGELHQFKGSLQVRLYTKKIYVANSDIEVITSLRK